MIDYLNRNAHDMPTIDADDFCADMGGTVCTDGLLAQAAPSTTVGKYPSGSSSRCTHDEPGAYPAIRRGASRTAPPCDRMRLTR